MITLVSLQKLQKNYKCLLLIIVCNIIIRDIYISLIQVS